jgi:WXXGXW repeat (2 copies)
MRMRWTWGVLAGVAAAALVGCVATETMAPARGVVVSGPPPAPIAEVIVVAPAPDSVWVAGYWHWTGMQYAWIPGHWEKAPPGTAWAAPRYVKADGAYVYEAGAWRPVRAVPATSATVNALR